MIKKYLLSIALLMCGGSGSLMHATLFHVTNNTNKNVQLNAECKKYHLIHEDQAALGNTLSRLITIGDTIHFRCDEFGKPTFFDPVTLRDITKEIEVRFGRQDQGVVEATLVEKQ